MKHMEGHTMMTDSMADPEFKAAVTLLSGLMQRAPKDITNKQIIGKTMRLLDDLNNYGRDLDAMDREDEYPLFTKTTTPPRERAKAKPGDLAEVHAYMVEKGDGIIWNDDQIWVEAEKFWNNQEARGWPTKDWKASVRTWLANVRDGRFKAKNGHHKALMNWNEMMRHKDTHAPMRKIEEVYEPVPVAGGKPMWRVK